MPKNEWLSFGIFFLKNLRAIKIARAGLEKALQHEHFGIKANRSTQALEIVTASCGKILGEVLPRKDDDEDELSNELILID